MSDSKMRYSKQRETIYEVLKNDCSHPNVDTIYMNVRKLIPDISLGTVYRNLNLLADQKRIQRLDVGDNTIHFDATIAPHYHLVCDCGAIEDLDLDDELISPLIDMVQEKSGKSIHSAKILFYGTCQNCSKKKS